MRPRPPSCWSLPWAPPQRIPDGRTPRIGEVEVLYGFAGDRKIVRKNTDPESDMMAAVDSGKRFPCYGVKKGKTHVNWYLIWVEEESVWGWISSRNASLTLDSGSYVSPDIETAPTGEEIGEVEILYGYAGDRKLVRKNSDPDSELLAAVDPGKRFPCFMVKKGKTHVDWYLIWVEEESVLGWISSRNAELHR